MIIDLDTLFPVRKTFTDIVSYCTDPFASVESKVFASLPADVECGDLITSTGAKYESGGREAKTLLSTEANGSVQ